MRILPVTSDNIMELGVAEAYSILVEHFGYADLPPLDAIENEDWGRDYLLSQFLEIPDAELASILKERSVDPPSPG